MATPLLHRPLWPHAPVEWHAQITSTNDRARELARQGAPEGTLVVADAQTAGRGRRGRPWSSAPGLGVWCSLIVWPNLALARFPRLTAWAALAAVRTAASFTSAPVGVKWPNDVLTMGRKLAGILVEAEVSGAGGAAAVVGIGLNVGHGPGDFPPEIRPEAVSLRMARPEGAAGPGRGEVLGRLLVELETLYAEENPRGFSGVVDRIRPYSLTLGRRVRVLQGGTAFEGVAVGFTEDGLLEVADDGGGLRVVHSGDVSLREPQ